MLRTAYFSLIESHISYALLGWGHSPHAKRIFALQRKVLRVLAGLGYRSDTRCAFVELGILTVPSLYIFMCLVLAKTAGEHAYHGDTHHYETRQRGLICLDYYRLNSSRYSGNYYSKKFFNKLPNNTKFLTTTSFKLMLKRWLLTRPYFTFDEFLDDDIPPDAFV